MDIQALSDRLEITDLLYRYTRIIDRAEIGRLTEIFLPDGRFRITDLPSGNRDFSVAEFSSYLQDTLSACNFMQHFMNNIEINLDGEQASTESYLAVMYELKPAHLSSAFGEFATTTDLFLTGEYRDELERTPKGWRIRTRTARFSSQRTRAVLTG